MSTSTIGIHAIAKTVAPLLFNGLTKATYNVNEGYPHLAYISLGTSNGEKIALRTDGDRIIVSGVWPTDSKGQTYYGGGSITIAASATPENIARQIEKRFLPAFLAAYAEQKKLADESSEHDAKTEANKKKFGRTLFIGENVYVRPEVNGDSLSLDIRRLTPDQADKIIALLRTFAAKLPCNYGTGDNGENG